MTFKEALDQGITKVRRLSFAEGTYIQLPPLNVDGSHGPWVKFFNGVEFQDFIWADHDGEDYLAFE